MGGGQPYPHGGATIPLHPERGKCKAVLEGRGFYPYFR